MIFKKRRVILLSVFYCIMVNNFSVNIIGSGNVAHYLANVFVKNNVLVKSVYSKNTEHSERFASTFNSKSADSISKLDDTADLYLIAISDQSILEVGNLLITTKPVVHTSGITPLKIISDNHLNAGVFYPLQTLTKQTNLLPENVPILIEANNDETSQMLFELAEMLGFKARELTSDKRQYLHLAAVFVNNFGNHLASIAQLILNEQSIPFELIKPLILETANKLQASNPELNQTGPAKRNDLTTIDKHLQLLNNKESILELYKLFSADILKSYSD